MTGSYHSLPIARYMWLAIMTLWSWLAPCPAGGQVPYADSLDAILLTYKTLPPLNDLSARVPDHLPDYRLIIAPPYAIATGPETADKFYLLHHTILDRTFICTFEEDRVAFVPTPTDPKPAVPFRVVQGMTDSLHGLEAFQVRMLENGDTLLLWNTLDLGINFPLYQGLRGVTLYREIVREGRRYRVMATRVERIRIPVKYVDPTRNQALYDFNAPAPLFEHPPVKWDASLIGLDGYLIPNYKGRTFPDRQPVSMRKLQGKIVPLVFADYQLIGSLPDFLLTWLEAAGRESDVKPIVITRTPLSDLRVILSRDPASARIPHLVIPDEDYFSLVFRAPYAVLLLDHGGIIRYSRNGLYILGTEAISRVVEDLRTAWSKGNMH